ncbi:phosphohistidine phosphatase SixA [[Eubacterium] cellulosolvens]
MRLYLVQHGLAKSKDEDPERPLTEMGWAETKKIATLVATVGDIKPSRIIHSGKTRAKQTAEMLAQHLEMNENIEQAEGLAPMDEPVLWLRKLEEANEDLMLVGHLPHLAKLAASLLFNDENKTTIKFRNSGIVCLERDNESTWGLNWIIIPDVLP